MEKPSSLDECMSQQYTQRLHNDAREGKKSSKLSILFINGHLNTAIYGCSTLTELPFFDDDSKNAATHAK